LYETAFSKVVKTEIAVICSFAERKLLHECGLKFQTS
jgi:hypothetical protein